MHQGSALNPLLFVIPFLPPNQQHQSTEGISSEGNIMQQIVWLMLLLLTVSCSRKSRLLLVLPFWYQLTRVVPDKIQRAVKWL